MALTPFLGTRDLFSPAEEFFGSSLLRPFEPFLGGRDLTTWVAPRSMPLDVVER